MHALDDDRLTAAWLHALGRSQMWFSELAVTAVETLEDAAERFRALGLHGAALSVDNTVAVTLLFMRDYDRGAAVNARCLEEAIARGARLMEGHCLGYSGELALAKQQYAVALQHYVDSAAIYTEVGIPTWLPRFNQGLCLIRLSRLEEAYAILDAVRDQLRDTCFNRFPGMVGLQLLLCATLLGDEDVVREDLSYCVVLLRAIQQPDEDLISCLVDAVEALKPWPELHAEAAALLGILQSRLH